MPILIYIALCVLVGYFGRNRTLGFWGYALASVIVSPLGGVLLLVPSEKKVKKIVAQETAQEAEA